MVYTYSEIRNFLGSSTVELQQHISCVKKGYTKDGHLFTTHLTVRRIDILNFSEEIPAVSKDRLP